MHATASAVSYALKAKLFRGFADASRLSILEALRDGPRSVGEVVELTGLRQSNVSNHLSCLLDCGLVERERRGRRVYYALRDDGVEAILARAERLLAETARGVASCPRYDAPGPDA